MCLGHLREDTESMWNWLWIFVWKILIPRIGLLHINSVRVEEYLLLFPWEYLTKHETPIKRACVPCLCGFIFWFAYFWLPSNGHCYEWSTTNSIIYNEANVLWDRKPLLVKISYLVFLGKRSTHTQTDGNKYFESIAELRGVVAFHPVDLARWVDIADRTRDGLKCSSVMWHRILYASDLTCTACSRGYNMLTNLRVATPVYLHSV